MSETTDSDERTDSIGLRDIEDIGVADGESWADAAARLRKRDDDRWHYCVCGARYRSRGPALKCCSERFTELVTDGGTPSVTETEHYADGSFVTCPDCSGDLKYQTQEVVICPDCDAEFSHFYADNGANELYRAPDMERVTTVYDPADDQRDDEELVTDGGQDQTPLDRLFVEDADDRPDEIVVENLTTLDADEFVARLESLAEAAETVSKLTTDLERLRQTGLSDDDARDLIYGRNAGVAKRDIEALFDAVDQLKDGRTKRDPAQRPVGLPPETADAVQTYLDEHRHDTHDDNGRQPLLSSLRGRPSSNTVRIWSYLATLPCSYNVCPHGKDIATCEWRDRAHASKCPSSRSPHQIRTGTITWLLNLGWPPQDVAERVNATRKTIEEHYDKASPEERRRRQRERMEDRRRQLVNQLDFTTTDDQ